MKRTSNHSRKRSSLSKIKSKAKKVHLVPIKNTLKKHPLSAALGLLTLGVGIASSVIFYKKNHSHSKSWFK